MSDGSSNLGLGTLTIKNYYRLSPYPPTIREMEAALRKPTTSTSILQSSNSRENRREEGERVELGAVSVYQEEVPVEESLAVEIVESLTAPMAPASEEAEMLMHHSMSQKEERASASMPFPASLLLQDDEEDVDEDREEEKEVEGLVAESQSDPFLTGSKEMEAATSDNNILPPASIGVSPTVIIAQTATDLPLLIPIIPIEKENTPLVNTNTIVTSRPTSPCLDEDRNADTILVTEEQENMVAQNNINLQQELNSSQSCSFPHGTPIEETPADKMGQFYNRKTKTGQIVEGCIGYSNESVVLGLGRGSSEAEGECRMEDVVDLVVEGPSMTLLNVTVGEAASAADMEVEVDERRISLPLPLSFAVANTSMEFLEKCLAEEEEGGKSQAEGAAVRLTGSLAMEKELAMEVNKNEDCLQIASPLLQGPSSDHIQHAEEGVEIIADLSFHNEEVRSDKEEEVIPQSLQACCELIVNASFENQLQHDEDEFSGKEADETIPESPQNSCLVEEDIMPIQLPGPIVEKRKRIESSEMINLEEETGSDGVALPHVAVFKRQKVAGINLFIVDESQSALELFKPPVESLPAEENQIIISAKDEDLFTAEAEVSSEEGEGEREGEEGELVEPPPYPESMQFTFGNGLEDEGSERDSIPDSQEGLLNPQEIIEGDKIQEVYSAAAPLAPVIQPAEVKTAIVFAPIKGDPSNISKTTSKAKKSTTTPKTSPPKKRTPPKSSFIPSNGKICSLCETSTSAKWFKKFEDKSDICADCAIIEKRKKSAIVKKGSYNDNESIDSSTAPDDSADDDYEPTQRSSHHLVDEEIFDEVEEARIAPESKRKTPKPKMERKERQSPDLRITGRGSSSKSVPHSASKSERIFTGFHLMVSVPTKNIEISKEQIENDPWLCSKDLLIKKLTRHGADIITCPLPYFEGRKRVKDPYSPLVLVCPATASTKKVLLALSLGIPIVSTVWILHCINSKKLLPFDAFRLSNGPSRVIGQQCAAPFSANAIFKGKKFYAYTGDLQSRTKKEYLNHNELTDWQEVLHSMEATLITRDQLRRNPKDCDYILQLTKASQQDMEEWGEWMVTSEFVIHCLRHQTLLDRDLLEDFRTY